MNMDKDRRRQEARLDIKAKRAAKRRGDLRQRAAEDEKDCEWRKRSEQRPRTTLSLNQRSIAMSRKKARVTVVEGGATGGPAGSGGARGSVDTKGSLLSTGDEYPSRIRWPTIDPWNRNIGLCRETVWVGNEVRTNGLKYTRKGWFASGE